MKALLLLFLLSGAPAALGQTATIPCSVDPNWINPTVTVCTPAMDEVTTSPVRIGAAGKSPAPFKTLQVYVDGRKSAQFYGADLDFNLPLTNGSHRVTVQFRDETGTGAINTFYIYIVSR